MHVICSAVHFTAAHNLTRRVCCRILESVYHAMALQRNQRARVSPGLLRVPHHEEQVRRLGCGVFIK